MRRVLVIDDEEPIRRGVALALRRAGFEGVVTEGDARAALQAVQSNPWDLVLLDLMMPEVHGLEILRKLVETQPRAACVVLTAVDKASVALDALRAGAVDYLTKPIDPATVVTATRRALGMDAGEEGLDHPAAFADIVVASPKMRALFRFVERVAALEVSVLVVGPSGSGKELFARAIHKASARATGPLVSVNVGAIPEALFAGQLFGHTAGAFSGASGESEGFCGAAAGGTLFLDEIGTLPLAQQAALLRVLDEREYYRLGETRPRRLGARLVLATNLDLREEVARGRFREDLYHRVSTTCVRVPSLAERPEDIPPLVAHFIRVLSREHGRPLLEVHPLTVELLAARAFPGNVRELKNVLHEALLREDSLQLRPDSLPEAYRQEPAPRPSDGGADLRPLADLEREHIERVLQATGSITRTAELLGLSRATLTRRLRFYRALP